MQHFSKFTSCIRTAEYVAAPLSLTSIKLLHDLISANISCKVALYALDPIGLLERRGMTPGLKRELLLDHLRKALGPSFARKCVARRLDELWVDEIGAQANVIEDSCKLQNLTDHSDVASFNENVLMPHDGFTDRICLIFGTSMIQNQVAGYDGALEFEGHLCRCQERVRRTDVVQEAGKIVGFGVIGPRWKVRFDERSPVDINAIAMIESLFVQSFLDECFNSLDHWRVGEWYILEFKLILFGILSRSRGMVFKEHIWISGNWSKSVKLDILLAEHYCLLLELEALEVVVVLVQVVLAHNALGNVMVWRSKAVPSVW